MKRLITSCTVALLIGGCIDTTKIAPRVIQLGIVEDVATLERGRDVYITKCTACHNAIRVTRFSRFEWDTEILPVMIEESSLSTNDANAITSYIHAVLKSQTELYSAAESTTH